MSVDKFGLMPGDSPHTTIIKPYVKYDYSLDDLENVEGFNEDGNENGIYGFKLTSEGIYSRTEITSAAPQISTAETTSISGGAAPTQQLDQTIKNKPVRFVLTDGQSPSGADEGKWLAIPDHEWDLDFRIKNGTVITGGKDQVVNRWINSGNMMVNLIPKQEKIIVGYRRGKYYLAGQDINDRDLIAYFRIKGEFDLEIKENLEQPVNDSVIIVEGFLGNSKSEYKELLKGFKFRWNASEQGQDFGIVIIVKNDSHVVRTSPSGIEVDVQEKIDLSKGIFLNENYLLTRFMYSKKPLSDAEIRYLD